MNVCMAFEWFELSPIRITRPSYRAGAGYLRYIAARLQISGFTTCL